MTDINTLEGHALNRAVAAALGWRIEPYEDTPPRILTHRVINPDGPVDYLGTDGDPWPACWLPDPECGDTVIPDYAHDLNAALALPLPDDWYYQVDFFGTAGHASVKDHGYTVWVCGADPAATAISRCWLEAQDIIADREAAQDQRDQT